MIDRQNKSVNTDGLTSRLYVSVRVLKFIIT
ncbi:hypothetical protein BuS5_02721 [Desulfosarcina sp. BuS5]|nr:hypothetical protein BuS5_02721 [Desulfosarcina sp. BuS5]